MPNRAKVSITLTVVTYCSDVFLYKLLDHRLVEYEINSLGTSVEVGDQGDQMLELPQPENVGATKLVEPTTEEHNQGDQMLELPPQEEPRSREPEVPTGSRDQQVEVDEIKGSEVQTEVFNREYEACHHFLSSNMYRRSHVSRYHISLLKRCITGPDLFALCRAPVPA